MNVCKGDKTKETSPRLFISSFRSVFFSSLMHSLNSTLTSATVSHSRSLTLNLPPTSTSPLSITITVAMATAILNGAVCFLFQATMRRHRQPKHISWEVLAFVGDSAAASFTHQLTDSIYVPVNMEDTSDHEHSPCFCDATSGFMKMGILVNYQLLYWTHNINKK